MNPVIINGKAVAKTIQEEVAAAIKIMKKNKEKAPHLAILLVGNDPASHTYVKNKIGACKQVGIRTTLIHHDIIGEISLLKAIDEVNQNDKIHSLIVQFPLPEHINLQKIMNQILPQKDVEGLHAYNYGRMTCGLPTFVPATPLGILELIRRYEIETIGKQCAIIGKSRIVGAPLSILLSRDGYPGDATVTLCHKLSKNLNHITQEADILISAVGKTHLITKDMVKKGAVVIDVGTTYVPDKTKKEGFVIKGDVDFKEVAPLCSYITPVPGGVGPMTIAVLLTNVLRAAQNKMYTNTSYLAYSY